MQSESVPKKTPERAAVRWVYESDEVSLSIRENWTIGLT